MDNNQLQYIKIQSQYADKVEQFEKCVVKAAKLTHAIADTAEKKCKQARMAMESGNIDVMRFSSTSASTDEIGHVSGMFGYSL